MTICPIPSASNDISIPLYNFTYLNQNLFIFN